MSHDTNLLRESLSSVARWRHHRVIVHVDLKVLTKEKHTTTLISDALLLREVGLEVMFVCTGNGTERFVERSQDRGVTAVAINDITDMISIVKEEQAVKVFFLCEGDGIFNGRLLIRDMTLEEAEYALKVGFVSGMMQRRLSVAVEMCHCCVRRVHFVNGRKEGAFLDEFLSDKGCGTMVYRDEPPYKTVRDATHEDVIDIAQIIRDSVDSSIVEEVIAKYIGSFNVYTVDGHVNAVVGWSLEGEAVKVRFLAHTTEFDASEALFALLQHVIFQTEGRDAKKILIDAGRAPALIGIWPWFLKLGFRKRQHTTSEKAHKTWEKDL